MTLVAEGIRHEIQSLEVPRGRRVLRHDKLHVEGGDDKVNQECCLDPRSSSAGSDRACC